MKQLILGSAIIFLFTIFLTFQSDQNRYMREYDRLKTVCDDLSHVGSLYYDENEYSDGNLIFNYLESNRAIEGLLKKNFKLDDNYAPMNTYWKNVVSFKVYYFDDSGICKVFDETKISQFQFTFNYLFEDKDTKFVKLITQPTVVVTVNTGPGRYRSSFKAQKESIRSSAYEWKGR